MGISRLSALRSVLLTIVIYLASSAALAEDWPAPFEQTFKSSYSGIPVTTERSLTALEDGTYQFRVYSKNFLARYDEKSIFQLDPKGDIQPLEHSVKSRVFGVSRSETTDFDWETMEATYTKSGETKVTAIEHGMLDRVLYQLLLPEDLADGNTQPAYDFVDRGRLKTYEFEVLAEETIETKEEEINALKLRRITDKEGRETLVWFASEHDYQLVKISHTEDDGGDYHMVLSDKL